MKVTIGGVTYNVEGTDDPEAAFKHAKEFAQQDLNKKAQDEYSGAPAWSKPFMAAQDVARTVADTASLGYADKMTDYMSPPAEGQPSQAEITKAIRSRMTGADVAADIGVTMAAAPTMVPRAVGALGGGAIARGITGGATAAAEGGVLGGLSAAGHDQPVGEGVLKGVGAGVGGQAVAGMLTKPVNAAANWWKGANQALPPITERQFRQASKLVGDDPATKAFSAAGSVLTPGIGAAMAGPKAYFGMKGASAAAEGIANQGRREKVDDLRRMYSGQPRVKGPLTDEERLALGLRGRFSDYMEE